MQEKGISREFLMNHVSGIGPVRLSGLFKGEWQPSDFTKRRIAGLLDCSLEWLTGETDDPTPIEEEPAPLVVPGGWPGFYQWLTDRRYLGMEPPWKPKRRIMRSNAPCWFNALDDSLTEGYDEIDCLSELTNLEIQVLCNWIRNRSARRHRLSMSLFAPGPKVIQLDQARARLRQDPGSRGGD
jgi:hypothetical protein